MFCQVISGTAFIGKGSIAANFAEGLQEIGRGFERGYNAAFLHVLFSDEPTMIEWLLNN